MGCLYRITSPDGKQYIGISMGTAEKRFSSHCEIKPAERKYLQHAIAKHGRESMKLETLVVVDDWKYLCELERKAIVAFNTRFPNGYNLTDGGEGFKSRHSEATRAKMSKSHAGREITWGEKISKAKLGKPRDEATKKKLSAAAKLQWAEGRGSNAYKLGNQNAKGHKVSAEARIKMMMGAAIQGCKKVGRQVSWLDESFCRVGSSLPAVGVPPCAHGLFHDSAPYSTLSCRRLDKCHGPCLVPWGTPRRPPHLRQKSSGLRPQMRC